jgi:hypothetical protein
VQVLLQGQALVLRQLKALMAAHVQAGDLALLFRLVLLDQFGQAHLLPAVPQAKSGSNMAHQVIDIARIGVPVLGGSILQLGDHQGRRRLRLRLTATKRNSGQRQRRHGLRGGLPLRILARRRATGPELPRRLLAQRFFEVQPREPRDSGAFQEEISAVD